MSAQIEYFPDGDNSRLNQAWKVKELIRSEQGLLHQKWSFFRNIYESGHVYLVFSGDNELTGFAIINKDHYLSLLAIHPDHQGEGIGTDLIELLQEDYSRLTCHTRVSNEQAVTFYEERDFHIQTMHASYYENSEDAYYLEYSEE